MKQAAKKTTAPGKTEIQPAFDGWVVALQLVDTGLRVAIPILVLSWAGIKLDKHLQTGPAFTLVGFFLSLALSTMLVYKQINAAYPDFFSSAKKGKNQ